MMMSLLERLNHAFSGGIMFVQPTAETQQTKLHLSYEFLSIVGLTFILRRYWQQAVENSIFSQ